MKLPRLTPSFVVAVLALVVASGGVGFAAGQITSVDIRDNSVQSRDLRDNNVSSRDVADGTLTRRDVRPAGIPRSRLDRSCPVRHAAAFGGCVRYKPYGPSSHQASIDTCSRLNGRLPTIQELRWIAAHDEYTWANGNNDNYEFSGDSTSSDPLTPIGARRSFMFSVSNASAQYFWFHCVVSY